MTNVRLAVLGVATVLVAACSNTPAPRPGLSGTASATLSVVLHHVPLGVANLVLDATTNVLIAEVTLSGMVPGRSHPVHIHAGSCGGNGKIAQTIGVITADANGNAQLRASIEKVPAIPTATWYVDVHSGAALETPAERRSLSCGNVIVQGADNTGKVTAYAALIASPTLGNNVAGTASLKYDASSRQLTVRVLVDGFEPNTVHPNHVHNGSCESQGGVAYPLSDLKADERGHAEATTDIKEVAAMKYGEWYLNVHQGPALDSQTGFAPLACGNVAGGNAVEASPSPSPSAPGASPSAAPTSPSPTP